MNKFSTLSESSHDHRDNHYNISIWNWLKFDNDNLYDRYESHHRTEVIILNNVIISIIVISSLMLFCRWWARVVSPFWLSRLTTPRCQNVQWPSAVRLWLINLRICRLILYGSLCHYHHWSPLPQPTSPSPSLLSTSAWPWCWSFEGGSNIPDPPLLSLSALQPCFCPCSMRCKDNCSSGKQAWKN